MGLQMYDFFWKVQELSTKKLTFVQHKKEPRMLNVIALAVLPALILLFYTYQQDRLQREPVREVLKGFGWGCLSVLCSLCISVPLMSMGWVPPEIDSFWSAAGTAFFGAAIPEETAKLFCLWLFLKKNPYFDERMDGIVYAVSVGMGFAAFENVEYLLASGTQWVTTGIGRSLTAIPGHFGFAVIMGYYFSLNHFDRYRSQGAAWKMWLYPVLAHGIYDTVAMLSEVNAELSGVITIAILLFVFRMIKWARARMEEHLVVDATDVPEGIDEQ